MADFVLLWKIKIKFTTWRLSRKCYHQKITGAKTRRHLNWVFSDGNACSVFDLAHNVSTLNFVVALAVALLQRHAVDLLDGANVSARIRTRDAVGRWQIMRWRQSISWTESHRWALLLFNRQLAITSTTTCFWFGCSMLEILLRSRSWYAIELIINRLELPGPTSFIQEWAMVEAVV